MSRKRLFYQVVRINKMYLAGEMDEETFYLLRSKIIAYLTRNQRISNV
jgi:hypothetical protein